MNTQRIQEGFCDIFTNKAVKDYTYYQYTILVSERKPALYNLVLSNCHVLIVHP